MKTWTKICGIKTFDALDAAIDGGADYVGLVFFEKSPRNVTIDQAAALAYHAGGTRIVALVVDADDALLKAISSIPLFDFLQLHGIESPERVMQIRELTDYNCKIWKAIPVSTAADAARAFDYADIADRILFDAKPPKGAVLPGGNGHAFDWSALDAIKGKFKFILSGGLNPENVAEAIRATNPWGVDVSSGVESSPGVKDPAMIRAFLRAVNGSR